MIDMKVAMAHLSSVAHFCSLDGAGYMTIHYAYSFFIGDLILEQNIRFGQICLKNNNAQNKVTFIGAICLKL